MEAEAKPAPHEQGKKGQQQNLPKGKDRAGARDQAAPEPPPPSGKRKRDASSSQGGKGQGDEQEGEQEVGRGAEAGDKGRDSAEAGRGAGPKAGAADDAAPEAQAEPAPTDEEKELPAAVVEEGRLYMLCFAVQVGSSATARFLCGVRSRDRVHPWRTALGPRPGLFERIATSIAR